MTPEKTLRRSPRRSSPSAPVKEGDEASLVEKHGEKASMEAVAASKARRESPLGEGSDMLSASSRPKKRRGDPLNPDEAGEGSPARGSPRGSQGSAHKKLRLPEVPSHPNFFLLFSFFRCHRSLY